MVLSVKALLDEIQWDMTRTPDAERAWERLGLHLGFTSTRPERFHGRGPDNLWALSVDRHTVIELKTGCETDFIAKSDMDQLGGSVRWDEEHHPGVRAVPVMVHPSRQYDGHGTVVPNMRVVTPLKLEELKRAVTEYVVALADGQGHWTNEQAVAVQLAQHRLDGGNLFQTYAEAAQAAPRNAAGSAS
jgi:hypothetical protein